MTKQKFRKRLLAIFLSLLALVAIGFGGSYLYYSTGHQAEDPKGLASIQGLNNAEDMVQLVGPYWQPGRQELGKGRPLSD